MKIDRVFIRGSVRKLIRKRDGAPFLFLFSLFSFNWNDRFRARMRVSVLAAGQISRTVSDREHRTHHTDGIESGNLDEVWKIFRIRSRSNLFNGQSIYLTDKVTNDTLHRRCCDYYYYAINAINESRNCIDGGGWQGNLGYQLYTSIPFIHFLCVSLYVHSRVKFIACVIFLVFCNIKKWFREGYDFTPFCVKDLQGAISFF